ncbi:MAG: hypothetical protein WCO65_00555 [bacterium]
MKDINKEILVHLYFNKNLSISSIAKKMDCSQGKINYYFKKFEIKKRTISEAVYQMHNPKGDPFEVKSDLNIQDYFLLGLGLGLYWGEGNKKNKNSVRLGNSDPDLIYCFIDFLESIYKVNKKDMRFNLQIFDNMDSNKLLNFWTKKLRVSKNQFYKIVVTPRRGQGTYKDRVEYGVLTVCFNNTKLRNLIMDKIENITKMY